jgi:hypothetical protein
MYMSRLAAQKEWAFMKVRIHHGPLYIVADGLWKYTGAT